MTPAERTVFFPAGGEELFGILATPAGSGPSDVAVVVLAEGIPAGMRGQNAVLVRLARAVAGAGYASFRFDYHGVGESTGPTPHIWRDTPFLDDLDAAFGWLRTQGYRRFLVAGSCFGAQTALLAVPGRPEICGVALLSCLVAVQADPLIPPSAGVIAAVMDARDRDLPVLFCYGNRDPQYAEFEAARPFGLEAGLRGASVDVEVLDGELHTFRDVDLQGTVIETVVGWVRRVGGLLREAAPVTGSWTSP